MTTQQLECFIRVADKLNFTKAAQEMFLTTPTVTHHIKSLEEELGAHLLRQVIEVYMNMQKTIKIHLFHQ